MERVVSKGATARSIKRRDRMERLYQMRRDRQGVREARRRVF